LTDEKKSGDFRPVYLFVVQLQVQKSGKSLFSQLGFPFLNGNLKNSFIFNFQLSILPASGKKECR
jgi:hypothetical protein